MTGEFLRIEHDTSGANGCNGYIVSPVTQDEADGGDFEGDHRAS